MNKEWNNESENEPHVPAKDEARKITFRGSYSGVDDELIMWSPDLLSWTPEGPFGRCDVHIS